MKRLSPWLAAAASVALGACQQLVMLENHGSDGGGGSGAPPTDGPASSGDGQDVSGGGGQAIPTDGRDDAPPACNNPRPRNLDIQQTQPVVVLSLDRSSSMLMPFGEGTRLAVAQQTLRSSVMTYQGSIRFAYQEFPVNSTSCTGSLGCCAGKVGFPMFNNYEYIAGRMTECERGVGGCVMSANTPTAEAMSLCRDAFSSNSITERHILLLTDGEPSCARNGSTSSACDDAVNELGTLNLNSGVRTIVVGVGEEVAHSDCLNEMASAGGAPRQGAGQQYYAAHTAILLKQYVGDVVKNIAKRACHFEVLEQPGDPEQVTLYFDNRPIQRDQNERYGWNYDGTSTFKFTVYGPPCDLLQIGKVREIDFRSCR